jgi:archaellum biogenesis ATPase FlaH
MPHLPSGLSPRVDSLAKQLLVLSYTNRDLVLRKELTAKEVNAVKVVDTESPQPPPPLPEYEAFTIIHARDLKYLPPLTWLVPGEIVEGGLCVLYGESGAGKSFVSLDYALRVAQTSAVIYIPTEGEAGYRKRVAAWCHHHQKSEGNLQFIFGSASLFDRATFDELLDTLQQMQPKLVIIDTLAMAMAGGDENSARDMGIVMRNCRAINHRLKAAVLLVHHVNKAGVVERGSGALRGNADTMIKVSPADDLILVECAKTKDEKPFEPRYLFLRPVDVPDIGESLVPVPSAQYKADDTLLTPNQRKLLEALALETHRDGATTRDLEILTGVSAGVISRILSNLMKKSLVHKPFGSYAITEQGLKALGKSPVIQSDPTVIHNGSADDSRDSRDSRKISLFRKQKPRESSESTESSRGTVNQDESQPLDMQLFDLATRRKSHYDYNA